MKKSLPIVVLALWLTACAGVFGLAHKPEVSVAGLNLLQFGVFEQRFALRLRVQNPNDVELPIRGLSFDIQLNGQPFVRGVSDKTLTVPRYGEAVLDVAATSTLGNAVRQLRELQKAGQERIDYRLIGHLQLQGLGSLPFERRGDLQLPALDNPPRKKTPSTGI